MKRLVSLFSALMFGYTLTTTMLVPSIANADGVLTMYSPPLYIYDGTSTTCALVNGGDRPVRIFAQIINGSGQDVTDFADSRCEVDNQFELEPGQFCSVRYTMATGGGGSTCV